MSGRKFIAKVSPCFSEQLEQRLLLAVTISDSLYNGGNNVDEIFSGVVDSAGNTIVCGSTKSSDLVNPTYEKHALEDVYIIKYDPEGDVTWCTYFGGNGADYAYGMAIDSSDSIYICGRTSSMNLDFENSRNPWAGGEDGFVAKFNSSGVEQWNTFWGGDGNDAFYDIAVTANNEPVMTGVTASSELNGYHGGATDIVISKLTSLGQTNWNLLHGDSSADEGRSIALDSLNNIYIGGKYVSGGVDHGFIRKYIPEGYLALSANIAGNGADNVKGVALDSLGNVYVTGYTQSTNLSATQTAYGSDDIFLAKYTSALLPVWMKTVGGSNSDKAYSIAISSTGIISISGSTSSADMLYRLNDPLGGQDAALSMFSTGGLYYGTFLFGGSGTDAAYGVTLDTTGKQYLCGTTDSLDFEGATNVASASGDGFVTSVKPLRVLDPARIGTYTDSAGNTVTVSLKGGGWGFVVLGDAGDDAQTIITEATTLRSSLTVGVRGLTGATTTIKQIDVEGALKSVSGRALYITEGLYSSDIIVKMQIKGTTGAGQKDIMIGDNAPASLLQISLDLGNISEVNFTSEFAIKSLKIWDWADSDNNDSFSAPFIGAMSVTSLFYCEDINLTGESLLGVSLKSFRGTYVDNVSITATGYIGRMTAWEWAGGTITAQDITSLSITGNLTQGMSGDFMAALVLTDSSPAELYARSRIAGSHL